MAGDGMDVDLDDLRRVTERLGRFITEFDELGGATEDVQDAVGRPTGDGRLRGRVGDFESGWNGNREVVQESLDNVHSHLADFVDNIDELDRNLATDEE